MSHKVGKVGKVAFIGASWLVVGTLTCVLVVSSILGVSVQAARVKSRKPKLANEAAEGGGGMMSALIESFDVQDSFGSLAEHFLSTVGEIAPNVANIKPNGTFAKFMFKLNEVDKLIAAADEERTNELMELNTTWAEKLAHVEEAKNHQLMMLNKTWAELFADTSGALAEEKEKSAWLRSELNRTTLQLRDAENRLSVALMERNMSRAAEEAAYTQLVRLNITWAEKFAEAQDAKNMQFMQLNRSEMRNDSLLDEIRNLNDTWEEILSHMNQEVQNQIMNLSHAMNLSETNATMNQTRVGMST
eukprot:gnl/MRDRNA2_/MRDRNA2_117754_c0_seq1.p1 gnl/MRDRNA2_/MRDRNA2_117754_c0~~gnl/MRDRNA2_/MRDRNA2_117754_c0_seq1.p1  ORF type:complete len:303 (+),score=64.27 gnl/MRDRNA2_/MRDRNA2_117754_c0_seq1:93-1001(+)